MPAHTGWIKPQDMVLYEVKAFFYFKVTHTGLISTLLFGATLNFTTEEPNKNAFSILTLECLEQSSLVDDKIKTSPWKQ